MASQKSATSRLNLGLRIFFSEFVRVSLRRPSQALFFGRTVLWQAAAADDVGISFTVTRATFDTVADVGFLQHVVDKGCRFFLLRSTCRRDRRRGGRIPPRKQRTPQKGSPLFQGAGSRRMNAAAAGRTSFDWVRSTDHLIASA